MLTPANPPSATTGQLLVTALLTFSGTGVAGVLASALLGRRKASADVRKTDAETEGAQATAASVLTGSAVSMLTRMDGELARLSAKAESQDAEIRDLRTSIEESQQRERGHVRQLAAYRHWIEMASRLLAERGIPIDPPPHDEGQWPALPPDGS